MNKNLFIIDLDSDTYVRLSTVFGLFDGQPDQMQRLVSGIDDIVYFNEDQGVDAGIHGRNMEGQFFTILEAPGCRNDWTCVGSERKIHLLCVTRGRCSFLKSAASMDTHFKE
jgi:hypothetical protein